MNKKQALEYARIARRLNEWGFIAKETEALFRIQNTLRNWFSFECGTEHGAIERDETTGKPFFHNSDNGIKYPVPDRETAARKRLARIMAAHSGHVAYVQEDPRGCALYIVPKAELADGANIDSVYSSRGEGICY